MMDFIGFLLIGVVLAEQVPLEITPVYVLSATNETLLFSWRNPIPDNSSVISHYMLRLSLNQQLVADKSMVVQSSRKNLMYIFVGLDPGERYEFQVQACNDIGCGNWSNPLDAETSDGMADPPDNIEIKCLHDNIDSTNYVLVTWDEPRNVRGTLQGYNVTLEGETNTQNATGSFVTSTFQEFHEIQKENRIFNSTIRPNTNYNVMICTVNKYGCGHMSIPTEKVQCNASPPCQDGFLDGKK